MPLGGRLGERLVGVGSRGLVVFETVGGADPNVTDLVREGRRWAWRATNFAELQLQNYDDLGSRVVVSATRDTAAGTLVSVTPDLIAIRQNGRLREFAADDVVGVRSRSAVKISALVGLLAGAAVGLGVYIAADKSCEGSADPGECRVIGVLAPVLLPAMYATVGGGVGAAVGLLIPGPRLYQREGPAPGVAIAFRW
jgi:hypothetical protein